MRNVLGGVLVLALTALVLPACGEDEDPSSHGLESSLEAGFIDPLTDAGIGYEVLDTCQYNDNDGETEKWDFATQIYVDATPETVTKTLAATVGLIDAEVDPILVQQSADDPDIDWSGSLVPSGDGVRLELINHNANVGSTGPLVGWQEICPGSVTDQETTG
ncbi:MAG: hypothetical protein IH940_06035 [Acidobacteria bacterium]|nr:hypothetical protein [Acidobacteriota bacterium]